MWVRWFCVPFILHWEELEGLLPSEKSGKWGGVLCGPGELRSALTCSFLLPILFVPGLMLGTGDRERSQLSRAHGKPEGQGGKGRGHKEVLQEKVRWRGLAGPPLTP